MKNTEPQQTENAWEGPEAMEPVSGEIGADLGEEPHHSFSWKIYQMLENLFQRRFTAIFGRSFRNIFPSGPARGLRRNTAIDVRAQKMMRRFEELRSIPRDVKRKLRPLISRDLLDVAEYETARTHWEDRVPKYVFWSGVAGLFFVPALVSFWRQISFNLPLMSEQAAALSAPDTLYHYGICLALQFIAVFLMMWIANRLLSAEWQQVAWLLSCLVLSGLFLIWVHWSAALLPVHAVPGKVAGELAAELSYMRLWGVIGVSVVAAIFYWQITTFALGYPPGLYIEWWTQQRLNERVKAVVEDGLVRLLHFVEKEKDQWDTQNFKIHVCSGLEDIALRLEGLGQRTQTGDTETHRWYKQQMAETAQAFRAKKQWVLNPGFRSRERLIDFLSDSLENVAVGAWDRLETEPVPATTLRQESKFWAARVGAILKNIVISAIPLLLIFAMQSDIFSSTIGWKLPPGTNYEGYAYLFGFGWFVLSFIIMLDPQYQAKLNVIKDFRSILPGGKSS